MPLTRGGEHDVPGRNIRMPAPVDHPTHKKKVSVQLGDPLRVAQRERFISGAEYIIGKTICAEIENEMYKKNRFLRRAQQVSKRKLSTD